MNIIGRRFQSVRIIRPLIRLNSSFLAPVPPVQNNTNTRQKRLETLVPKLSDQFELEEAREFVYLLSKFDSGIFKDDKACSRLAEILYASKKKSQIFKEIVKVSKHRLLQILFTNRNFKNCFYLLQKDNENKVLYQPLVPPSVVAGTLVNLNKLQQLEEYMKFVLNDKDLATELKRKFIRSVVKNLMNEDRIGLAFKFWYQYSLLKYGHLNFDNYVKFADTLSTLFLIMSQYNSGNMIPFLIRFKELNQLSNHHFSMLLSSCMYTLSGKLHFKDLLLQLWQYKIDKRLEFVPSDLTAMMSNLYRNRENDEALAMYNKNNYLHEDAQFDYLLMIHGAKNEWQSMQKQFEDLFGRGELPNILHYGIVMNALASKGETSAVMMLWDQLHSRKMIPTIPILHALILCNITTGNYRNAILWFSKMPTYGLNYTRQSYNYLFRALRFLKENKIQLLFFKRLIFEENFELDHQSFNEILMTCLELNDSLTAEFVYKTLKSLDYDLGESLDVVMLQIYNNTENFTKVEQFLARQTMSTKLYNQLLIRHSKVSNYSKVFEIIAQMRTEGIQLDIHSYLYLLQALLNSDNLDQVLKLFNDLSPQFSIKNYNHFLNSLYDSPHYKLIPEVYDKIIETNLTPNLESYQWLIKGLCKQYQLDNADPELSIELAVKVVNTLIRDKKNGDLIFPAANLPFKMVLELLIQLMKYDFSLCKSLLVEFYESCDDKLSLENDLKFNYISLKIYENDGNLKEFNNLFMKYSQLLESKFLIDPRTEQKRANKTSNKIKYGLSQFWPSVLKYHRQSKQMARVKPLMDEFLQKGFLFTNTNINQTAMTLLYSKETYETALDIIEKQLIDGYIYLRRKRKHYRLLQRSKTTDPPYSTAFQLEKPTRYLQGLPYIQMVQLLDKRILSKGKARVEELDKLKLRFPKTLRFFVYRARVADKFFVTYTRFKDRKKIKFANQVERDAFNRKRKQEYYQQIADQKRQARLLLRLKLKATKRRRKFRKGERFGFTPRGSGIGRYRSSLIDNNNNNILKDDEIVVGPPPDIQSPFVTKVNQLISQQ